MSFKKTVNGFNNKQELDERDEYSISYAFVGVQAFGEGDTDYETAIVVHTGSGNKYYILNGDHRNSYAKCKTLKACMKYFNSKQKLKSSWSE